MERESLDRPCATVIKTHIEPPIHCTPSKVARLASLLFLALSPQSRAEEKYDTGGPFATYFESDLFLGTDEHDTCSVKLSWCSPDLDVLSI